MAKLTHCDNPRCARLIEDAVNMIELAITEGSALQRRRRADLPLYTQSRDFCSWTCVTEYAWGHARAERLPLTVALDEILAEH